MKNRFGSRSFNGSIFRSCTTEFGCNFSRGWSSSKIFSAYSTGIGSHSRTARVNDGMDELEI